MEAFGELSGRELREALDEATRARLVSALGGDGYRFAHDLVRQRVLAGMPLPRLQAYHLAVADTLERLYGKTAKDHASEIAFHLYQAGTAAAAVRTSSFLAQAAKNALAVGAFEEVLRTVESALVLLPGDKARERAEALAIRAEALSGLGRKEDARSAWNVAAQRFDEIGDKGSAAAIGRPGGRRRKRPCPPGGNAAASHHLPRPSHQPGGERHRREARAEVDRRQAAVERGLSAIRPPVDAASKVYDDEISTRHQGVDSRQTRY
jgi:tetratricopeptide (TPR) repeat protein